jgi:hypothetical protein
MKSISRGVGFMVLIFGVGCILGGYVLANKLGGEGYFQQHAWPLAAAVFASAAIAFVFGRRLNKPARKDANPRRPWTHDFLFLRMETWAYPLAVAALAVFLTGYKPGDSVRAVKAATEKAEKLAPGAK